VSFLKKSNLFIAWVLGIIGFSYACTDPVVEYGTPTALFKINGSIVSETENTAIPNIKIVSMQDSVHTNSDGNFLIKHHDFPESVEIQIKVRDIDGAENGSFEDLDTIIKFENPEFENGDGSWYSGEISKNIQIKLKSVDEE